MSRLLGPLSVITSRVSWRDWALAGDHTAGVGNRLPAATAVIDLRNSRRLIGRLRARGIVRCHGVRKGHASGGGRRVTPLKASIIWRKAEWRGGTGERRA